jgi:hypothetical protein
MSDDVECGGCGRRLRARHDLAGRPVRCPVCGAVWRPHADAADQEEVPYAEVEEEAITVRPPRDVRYPAADCPACGAGMQAGGVLCLECGYDRRTGRRREVVVERLHRRWASDWPYPIRIIFFVVFEAVAGLACYLLMALHSPWWLLALAPWTVLMALWLGGYYVVELDRTHKGRLKIHLRRWIAFIPLRTRTAVVQPGDALVLADADGPTPGDWLMDALTAPRYRYGGWGWSAWPMGADPGRIYVSFRLLFRSPKRPDLLLYKGDDEKRMQDIVETIQGAVEIPLLRR